MRKWAAWMLVFGGMTMLPVTAWGENRAAAPDGQVAAAVASEEGARPAASVAAADAEQDSAVEAGQSPNVLLENERVKVTLLEETQAEDYNGYHIQIENKTELYLSAEMKQQRLSGSLSDFDGQSVRIAPGETVDSEFLVYDKQVSGIEVQDTQDGAETGFQLESSLGVEDTNPVLKVRSSFSISE